MPWLGGWSPGSVGESVRTAPDTGTPCPHGGGQSYVEEAVEGERKGGIVPESLAGAQT